MEKEANNIEQPQLSARGPEIKEELGGVEVPPKLAKAKSSKNMLNERPSVLKSQASVALSQALSPLPGIQAKWLMTHPASISSVLVGPMANKAERRLSSFVPTFQSVHVRREKHIRPNFDASRVSQGQADFRDLSFNWLLASKGDVREMWKKARTVFHTLVKLRQLSKEIQTYGTAETHKEKQVEQLLTSQHTLTEEVVPIARVWYIIYPDSIFKMSWNLLLCLILMYTAIVTPLRIVFFDEESVVWDGVETAVDILFWIDMLVNFFSAYYDKDDHLVANLKTIVLNYLKSWFIIDLIACFPFDALTRSGPLSIAGQYNAILRIMRLPRLYRLIKLSKLFGAMKIMTAGGVLESSSARLFEVILLSGKGTIEDIISS